MVGADKLLSTLSSNVTAGGFILFFYCIAEGESPASVVRDVVGRESLRLALVLGPKPWHLRFGILTVRLPTSRNWHDSYQLSGPCSSLSSLATASNSRRRLLRSTAY